MMRKSVNRTIKINNVSYVYELIGYTIMPQIYKDFFKYTRKSCVYAHFFGDMRKKYYLCSEYAILRNKSCNTIAIS